MFNNDEKVVKKPETTNIPIIQKNGYLEIKIPPSKKGENIYEQMDKMYIEYTKDGEEKKCKLLDLPGIESMELVCDDILIKK